MALDLLYLTGYRQLCKSTQFYLLFPGFVNEAVDDAILVYILTQLGYVYIYIYYSGSFVLTEEGQWTPKQEGSGSSFFCAGGNV